LIVLALTFSIWLPEEIPGAQDGEWLHREDQYFAVVITSPLMLFWGQTTPPPVLDRFMVAEVY
jgi:hypothetical protein